MVRVAVTEVEFGSARSVAVAGRNWWNRESNARFAPLCLPESVETFFQKGRRESVIQYSPGSFPIILLNRVELCREGEVEKWEYRTKREKPHVTELEATAAERQPARFVVGRHHSNTQTFSTQSRHRYTLSDPPTKHISIMADTHTASVEEANAARLPLGYRDQCSAYVSTLHAHRHALRCDEGRSKTHEY